MVYNPKIYRRKSIRLKGYDYSQSGMYYITIATQNWLRLFGHVKNGNMVLNDAGAMVESVWCDIPKYYPGFDVDEYVVMPNHFHGIIVINEEGDCADAGDHPNEPVGVGPSANPDQWVGSGIGATGDRPNEHAGIRPDEQEGDAQTEDQISTKLSLSDEVGRFKSMVMTHYSSGVKEKGWSPFYKKLWRRNYYDHVIRNEKDYERIV